VSEREGTKVTPEGLVLDAVLDYLAAVHVTAWRMNTGAMRIDGKDGKKDRFIQFGIEGFSDILAIPIVRGKLHGTIPCSWCAPWFIEVKSATGRQSAEQKSFERQVKDAGAEYVIVRSVEEMAAVLKKNGVIS
jgi:hypothetical protein